MPPSRHATRLLLSPRCRAPLAPLPLAPSSSVRPCQAQEGFWSGAKEVPRWVPLAGSSLCSRGEGKAGLCLSPAQRYAPAACCRLGAAALACLVQDQRQAELRDGERPSPIPAPPQGR